MIESVLAGVGPAISFIRAVLPSIARAIDKGWNPAIIDRWLKLAQNIIEVGEEVPEKIRLFNDEVNGWIDSGKAPSAEWWDAMEGRSDDAYQRIKAEAERRRGEQS